MDLEETIGFLISWSEMLIWKINFVKSEQFYSD